MKLLAALLSLFGFSAPAADKPNLLHMPKDGKCPPGFKKLPYDPFVQKDGTTLPGCFAEAGTTNGKINVDHLGPGESVQIKILTRTLPEKRKA